MLQPAYKQKYEKTKDKHAFKPTDTVQYKAMKDNEKSSSDVSLGLSVFLFCFVSVGFYLCDRNSFSYY